MAQRLVWLCSLMCVLHGTAFRSPGLFSSHQDAQKSRLSAVSSEGGAGGQLERGDLGRGSRRRHLASFGSLSLALVLPFFAGGVWPSEAAEANIKIEDPEYLPPKELIDIFTQYHTGVITELRYLMSKGKWFDVRQNYPKAFPYMDLEAVGNSLSSSKFYTDDQLKVFGKAAVTLRKCGVDFTFANQRADVAECNKILDTAEAALKEFQSSGIFPDKSKYYGGKAEATPQQELAAKQSIETKTKEMTAAGFEAPSMPSSS
uniref:Uncharacterized protein n=1 Tax=Chromera velia CCMP2878 TaxID=1169474 RepID=A0A0G4HFG9_9ALVE|mmetsp:Transcript_12528/g.24354  ORF Transcript_12528/g.24354 Transcript_12528/m.24354 type:complete len:260 (+) Transcript_12528:133-912(+)|eukprot:Cvel_26941.t1-p1 / transcript=Cvel_26941.t1 / gene=Cvel_26941 / organism=Chromera_velia_CCMP2878 / gene_product=hypothetical protein / transcript_product=hypothetical protein / location=Cvel_scaffold3281:3908-7924(+) / protein_length=259 / sequence_SO=supercontig / SO=protein_coding / is_pseudo=false